MTGVDLVEKRYKHESTMLQFLLREDQRSNLDTLPRLPSLPQILHLERPMRRIFIAVSHFSHNLHRSSHRIGFGVSLTLRSDIARRVKVLEQQHLIRSLSTNIVPPVLRSAHEVHCRSDIGGPHVVRLNQIRGLHGTPVTDSQRHILDRVVDRTPHAKETVPAKGASPISLLLQRRASAVQVQMTEKTLRTLT